MFLALLLAGVPPVDPLQSAFRAAHRDYGAQLSDKFAEATADPAVVGQRFKFVGPVHNGQALGGNPGPFYTYDDGKLRLIFSLDDKYLGPGLIEGPKYMVGTIGGSRRVTDSYTGTNAFGVSARVKVERLEQNDLAMLERPEGEVSPYQSSIKLMPSIEARLPPPPRDTYWTEVVLPGPQARKLALDAGLVVEGEIATLANGKLNRCKGIYGGPEVDHPLEVYGSECWVAAKVTRIAFIRRSTGEVLKEWTTPAAQVVQ